MPNVTVHHGERAPFPTVDGGFGVILTDPPWAFRTYSGTDTTPSRTESDPYATVTTAELSNWPVGEIAAKNCVLLMWVIDSHIEQALRLGRAWGFTFKTRAFTWLKIGRDGSPIMGMGHWSRKETEICLLFTRGRPRPRSHGVREVIVDMRREHSRKPDEQYERIEALCRGPYVELFATQQWPGWASWGNQIGKHDHGAAQGGRCGLLGLMGGD